MTYDGTPYFYATNLQGDVLAILNSSGTAVVSYIYDAWGNHLSITGSLSGTLGYYNPLRYRGYVFDPEFELYYLQSRYYNAGLGRFNAPDTFAATGQGLLGNNMFAYCNNNPVILSDSSGTIPFYDAPIQKFIEEFCEWYRKTDENEQDENGRPTPGSKIKKTIQSASYHLEFSAGFGQGFYMEGEILDVGIGLGMYGNYGTINYNDGKWYTGQEVNIGLSLSIFQWLEFGFNEYAFLNDRTVIDASSWIGYNDTKESWTIFSVAAYFIGGGSIYVGFDLNSFLFDFNNIWMVS